MVKYITGVYALNIHGGNKTTGDWHRSILQDIDFSSTNDMHGLIYYAVLDIGYMVLNNIYVANHYKALADMFAKSINKKCIATLKYSVSDYLDGDSKGFMEYVEKVLNGVDHFEKETKEVLVHELGLGVCKYWE